jgi:hypothetical protein
LVEIRVEIFDAKGAGFGHALLQCTKRTGVNVYSSGLEPEPNPPELLCFFGTPGSACEFNDQS